LDYTPYAKARDSEIVNWAKENNLKVVAEEDYGMYDIMKG